MRIRGNPFQLFDPQYISPAALARELLAKIEGYPNKSGATLHGGIFTAGDESRKVALGPELLLARGLVRVVEDCRCSGIVEYSTR